MRTDKKNIKLQIGIAIFATLIPLLATFIYTITQENIKELSVYYSESEKLITRENNQYEKIKVYYDNSLVQNISILHLLIVNTGDYSITKDDFFDSPIHFEISNRDEVKRNNLPNILDVMLINDANQRNSILFFDDGQNSFSYMPSLLNKGEEVQIDILMPDNPNYDLKCIGKLKDGRPINLKSLDDIMKPSRFEMFIQGIQELFLFKWISVLISIVFSIVITLGGYGFIANAEEEEPNEYDLNIFGWIIGVSTILIGVIFLGLTIALMVI